MPVSELTALLLLSTVTSFTPGPNTTVSTAMAANFGLRRAMPFVCAVPIGWGLLFSLCAAGLGAVVLVVPLLRLGVQGLGMAYLLWLAFKLAGTKSLAQTDTAVLEVGFRQGVLLQFVNIKAWMLALTVVGGWLAGREDVLERFALILPLMIAFGFVSNLFYAVLGSIAREWLSGPVQEGLPTGLRLQWFNRVMAALLVLTALWMARA
jgi:threonine/homoserine/homoserine lactone efflux protein